MITTYARSTVAAWLESIHRMPWEAPPWTTRDLEEGLCEIRELGASDAMRAHKLSTGLIRTLPLLLETLEDTGRLEHFCRAVARTSLQLGAAAGQPAEVGECLLLETFAAHDAVALSGLIEVLEFPPLPADDRQRVARLAEQVPSRASAARREALQSLAARLRQA